MKKAYSLLISLFIGAFMGLLRGYGTLAEQLRSSGRPAPWLEKMAKVFYIPEDMAFPAWLNPIPKGQMAGFVFEPSVLMIGAGMITGLRVALSMLAGGILLYFVVAPRLLLHDLSQRAVVGYVPSFAVAPNGNFNPLRWALWAGTSMMVFSSLASMALQWRTIARAFRVFKRRENRLRLMPCRK